MKARRRENTANGVVIERRRMIAESGIRVAQERPLVVWSVVRRVWVALRVVSRN